MGKIAELVVAVVEAICRLISQHTAIAVKCFLYINFFELRLKCPEMFGDCIAILWSLSGGTVASLLGHFGQSWHSLWATSGCIGETWGCLATAVGMPSGSAGPGPRQDWTVTTTSKHEHLLKSNAKRYKLAEQLRGSMLSAAASGVAVFRIML